MKKNDYIQLNINKNKTKKILFVFVLFFLSILFLKITDNLSIVIYSNDEVIVTRQFFGLGYAKLTERKVEGKESGKTKINELPEEIRILFPES